MMLYTKYKSSGPFSDKNIFENCILKTYGFTLWPSYATNLNGLVGDHTGILPVKFGKNPMSGFRREDVKVKIIKQ